MDKATLILLSQILIVAGVLAIGALPFIELYQVPESLIVNPFFNKSTTRSKD